MVALKKQYVLEHIGLKTPTEMATELNITVSDVHEYLVQIRKEHSNIHPLLVSTASEEQYNRLRETRDIARRNFLIAEQELQKAQTENGKWKPKNADEKPPYSDEDITLRQHTVNSNMGLVLSADASLTRFMTAIGQYKSEMKVDGNQPVIIQVNMIDMGEAIPAEEPKKKEKEVNPRGK